MIKPTTKKDSACYSISDDNNSETDLTTGDIFIGSQSDLRNEIDQSMTRHISNGQFRQFSEGNESQSTSLGSAESISIGNSNRPNRVMKMPRRKYNARHGIIDVSDIPRIEIT
uniref:Uncharacterized protein n=1 Tax=Arion vulgaris TaxID=1028688 RepID=A0A0B6XX93_9EUPU